MCGKEWPMVVPPKKKHGFKDESLSLPRSWIQRGQSSSSPPSFCFLSGVSTVKMGLKLRPQFRQVDSLDLSHQGFGPPKQWVKICKTNHWYHDLENLFPDEKVLNIKHPFESTHWWSRNLLQSRVSHFTELVKATKHEIFWTLDSGSPNGHHLVCWLVYRGHVFIPTQKMRYKSGNPSNWP